MKNLVLITAAVALFSGCSFNNPFSSMFDEPESSPKQEIVVQKVDKDDIRDVMKKEKMKT